MIRLAAKLGMERSKQASPAPSNTSSNKGGIVLTSTKASVQDFVRDGREKVTKPVPLPPVEDVANMTSKKRKKQKKNKSKKKKSEGAKERRFQTKNIFDNLRELDLNPESGGDASEPEEERDHEMDEQEQVTTFDDAEAATAWEEQPDEQAGSWADEVFVQDKTGWVPIEQSQRHAMELIPAFDTEFWKEFGNTLRVFGTQEAVLKIADW
jgi:poly(A)-specific ribonuclease